MASLTRKKISGQTYYYARESRRINGKPKIVWQKYLGKIEDIIKAVESKDKHTNRFEFQMLWLYQNLARLSPFYSL